MNIFYIIGVVVVIIVVAGFLGLRVLGRAASLARGRPFRTRHGRRASSFRILGIVSYLIVAKPVSNSIQTPLINERIL
jgi:hypothetical protein